MQVKGTFWIRVVLILLLMLAASCSMRRQVHEGLRAVLWVQTAAEYRASAEQAYRIAKDKLDLALVDPNWTAALEQKEDYYQLPTAVILDIDETVLSNAQFQGQLLEEGKDFDKELWEKWVRKAEAAAVPGALEFVNYARSKGVEVFFVTNRTSDVEEATRLNLVKLGFPVKKEADNVLTKNERGWHGDKGSRRKYIARDHRILLLIGDNLNDFVSGAIGKGVTAQNRIQLADQHRSYWGEKWILLPNPIYGAWERALYGFAKDLPYTQRLKRKYEKLETLE